jgi:putative intracellular protease/amidase
MWDLAEDEHSIKLIESFIAAGKPIGIVCHSTGALHRVKTTDGKFLVQGKEVTGFTPWGGRIAKPAKEVFIPV